MGSQPSSAQVSKPQQNSNNDKIDNKQDDIDHQQRTQHNGPFKFHKNTEQNLVDFVKLNATQNDGSSVIQSIDTFCWDNHWMMHIGPAKGKILDIAIQNCKPKYILELGTYCGYSSIRMVTTNINENNINNTSLYSIEINKYNVQIAQQVIDYAGYNNNIKIFNKSTPDIIPTLRQEIQQIDADFDFFNLVFIDHAKMLYLSDLKLLEKNNLIKSGTYVVADNVVVFSINEYLSYVRNCGHYESKMYDAFLEYDKSQKHKDGVEISIRK